MIRPAKSADYEEVERIMKQVQKLHTVWRPDIYKPCDPVLPYEAYSKMVNSEEVLVAETDGKVVGLLTYEHRHTESVGRVKRDVLYIHAMVVDEAYRGQGIGHQFFDYMRRLAAEKNYDSIELQVNAKNRAAYEMYRNYGFREKSINMELL